MTKRMLIDAAHPEETRVVVMENSRVEEFDLEAANRLPLKGNIYLARVVRVEPSLQAAFVEYGGNRHGFLAFDEIHPDYYQIPVADREKLLALQAQEAREEDEAEERRAQALARRQDQRRGPATPPPPPAAAAPEDGAPSAETADAPAGEASPAEGWAERAAELASEAATDHRAPAVTAERGGPGAEPVAADEGDVPVAAADFAEQGLLHTAAPLDAEGSPSPDLAAVDAPLAGEARNGGEAENYGRVEQLPQEDMSPPETLGGPEGDGGPEGGPEATEDDRPRRSAHRFLRNYKIQEVIRRRQIMLVQVVKEERGTKGAALTTYISLAGRFSVLMPNSPRGGGVSRKITSASDRRRLREVIEELEMPQGMSLIVRTAGANRPKPEIRRDCEYLLSLWDSIRERTLASTAPALIYEEADLIKRAIRDGTAQQMDEILVEGDEAYAQARDFMRMLMPDHMRRIQAYRDGAQPLFSRFGAEQQLDAMHEPVVQLRSGGYLVINQTEALVAIDVNSGRSTRERHIEDTALKTNLEAAEEVARQLRLRDLAGLIVVDFIDMDSPKHNALVEKRMKEALRHDRARIQVGRISHFGLLEMSRQRLRPSLSEQSFVQCPHCLGRGQVRSVESSGIAVLRAIEEEGARRRSAEITVRVTTPVALWLLNRKRDRLAEIEGRWGMNVLFEPDDTLQGAETKIERSRLPPAPPREAEERPAALRMDYAPEPAEEDAAEEAGDAPPAGGGEARGNGAGLSEEQRRRRRRRRRGGRRENGDSPLAPGMAGGAEEGEEELDGAEDDAALAEAEAEGGAPEGGDEAPRTAETAEEREARRRRRGRRGGRRRREDGTPEGLSPAAEGVEGAEGEEAGTARPAPAYGYSGPTPADPFSGGGDSLLAAMEAAEAAALAEAEARRASRAAQPVAGPAATVAAEPLPAPAPAGVDGAAAFPPASAAEVKTALEDAPEAMPPVLPAPAQAEAEAAPETVPPASAAAEPAPAEPSPAKAAEPVIGAPVQPKLVEQAEAPRRGGWWKR